MGPELLRELRAAIHARFDARRRSRRAASSRPRRTPGGSPIWSNKGEVFRRAIVLPRMLEGVRHVLGADAKLSSLNARSADPAQRRGPAAARGHVGAAGRRGLLGLQHRVAARRLHDRRTARPAWCPARTRGASGRRTCSRIRMAPHPDEILLIGKAGSIAVMNSHLWHGGTANRTAAPRLAMHAFYCRRDKPQQQYQKQLLDPDVQAALSPELRRSPGPRRSAERRAQRRRDRAQLHEVAPV